LKKIRPSSFLPFINTFKNYKLSYFRSDAVAAISNVVIALPQAMACALIVGIDPVYGLYTVMLSIGISSLLGSSEFLITGTTSAISLLIVGSMKNYYQADNMLDILFMLTLMVGVIQLAFRLARIGKVLNYVSHSVLLGFSSGVGVMIALSQLNNWLGISIPNGSGMTILEKMEILIPKLGETNGASLGIGVLTIILVVIVRKLNKKLPAYFISIVITGILVYAIQLSQYGVALTKEVPYAITSFKIHDFSLLFDFNIWNGAIVIAIVGLVEAISISKAIGVKTNQEIDVNEEFRAQGITNIIISFFQGMTTSGSFTNTAGNYQNGAKTRMAGILTSVFLVLTLLLISPIIIYISLPALAGVMLLIAYNLIDKQEVRMQFRVGGVDLAVAIVTFAATIVLDIDKAVYIGVALSIIMYLKDTGKAEIRILVPSIKHEGSFKEREVDWVDTHEAEILILQFDGNLYFGLADDLKKSLEKVQDFAKVYILRMRNVTNIDATALEIIKKFVEREKENGANIIFAGLWSNILETLKKAEITDMLPDENFMLASEYKLNSSTLALETARKMVDTGKQ
jgi:SulP family sulfate permease